MPLNGRALQARKETEITEISERIADAYDRIATDYSGINAAMPANLEEIAARFLARVGSGAQVLDVGCGAGRDMAWMEARGAHVTGVDLSSGMLAQARRIVRGLLVRMDMCRLAFPASRFDGVWCCASLLHLPKAQAPAALAEMRRVLAPGGSLYVGVQEGEGEVWERTPYGDADRLFARYTMEETAALLSMSGFAVDEQGRSEARNRFWLNFLATAQTQPVASIST